MISILKRSAMAVLLVGSIAIMNSATAQLSLGDSAFLNCVRLTGNQEVPPVTTDAWGYAEIKIEHDGTIKGTITTHGIEGTVAYSQQGWQGTNGPAILTLQRGPRDTWVVPADSKLIGQQLVSFRQAKLYVIVDSAAHPDGEIRAQLGPRPAKACKR